MQCSVDLEEEGALLLWFHLYGFARCFEVQGEGNPVAICVAVLEAFHDLMRRRQCQVFRYSAERVCLAHCAVEYKARVASLCQHDVKLADCYALRPVFGGRCAIPAKVATCPAWIFLSTRERSRAGSLSRVSAAILAM